MKRTPVIILSFLALTACDKHDPILPGVRTPVFTNNNITYLNTNTPALSGTAYTMPNVDCPYTQDSSNTVWHGKRKIFSGFPTTNSVSSNQSPTCSGKYIYTGLTTGELVKINPSNKKIMWIADIYRPSNLTGGASVLDIVAPVIVRDKFVYAGGLGDAFCKINAASGTTTWCTNISTAAPFIIVDDVAFVPSGDKKLYAVRLTDGAIYWTHEIKTVTAPTYQNNIITVGNKKINAQSGQEILN